MHYSESGPAEFMYLITQLPECAERGCRIRVENRDLLGRDIEVTHNDSEIPLHIRKIMVASAIDAEAAVVGLLRDWTERCHDYEDHGVLLDG